MVKRPVQGFSIDLLEPTDKGRLPFGLVAAASAEKERAEDRSDGQGHKRGCHQGDYERDSQRLEHPSLHSGEEEQRQEAGDDDQRGVQHRHTDFL